MSEPSRFDLHGVAGSALAIAGGVLAWYYAGDFTPMGSVFPRTVAVVMIASAVVYIAVSLLRPVRQPAQAVGSVWRRVALVAVMVAWSTLLEKVGFLSTSVACFAAILVIANYDRWTPRMAAVYAFASALVVGGLYAIFRFVLQVPLPEGLLL
ncbi:MAG: tripartite tricarboxylate transporter TctB family protein [Lysobacter sp.]|nr:tripartite tricarboxylate transporter TctB family protein [Lysobacter sp.]